MKYSPGRSSKSRRGRQALNATRGRGSFQRSLHPGAALRRAVDKVFIKLMLMKFRAQLLASIKRRRLPLSALDAPTPARPTRRAFLRRRETYIYPGDTFVSSLS